MLHGEAANSMAVVFVNGRNGDRIPTETKSLNLVMEKSRSPDMPV
jgi:hypothetical protein